MRRTILRTIGKLWAFLFMRLITSFDNYVLRHIRTGYYELQLKHVGKCCIIAKNVRIDGGRNISIGDYTSIGRGTILSTWNGVPEVESPSLQIGCHVSIPENCHITSANNILIEDNVLFGKNVTVTDNSHGLTIRDDLSISPAARILRSKGPIHICKNVWIGDKATILPGVTIGESAIIGANSVVTRDVPSFSIYAGNPAKLIRKL